MKKEVPIQPAKSYRVGHLIQIPLLDDRFAYALYVMKSGWNGNIIWVFDPVHNKPVETMDEIEPQFLFGPVQTFLGSAISWGAWQPMGRYPHTITIPHPTFRKKVSGGWRLWSGGERTFCETLPPGGETLEYDGVWSFDLVEKRIRLGITEPVDVGRASPFALNAP